MSEHDWWSMYLVILQGAAPLHQYGAHANQGVLDEGAHWRHLANMTKPYVCSGDATLGQIALTSCSIWDRNGLHKKETSSGILGRNSVVHSSVLIWQVLEDVVSARTVTGAVTLRGRAVTLVGGRTLSLGMMMMMLGASVTTHAAMT